MTLHYPDLFDSFTCTGSECKDNCCRTGWDIEIDEDTYNYYRSLDTELGKRHAAAIYEEEGCRYMSQPDGCPFMNEKGLCSVQLEYGEEHISEICREHPRFYEWFGDYKEAGIGLCCEEAARQLVAHERPVIFTEKQIFREFKKLRDRLIEIAQDRGFSVTERLQIIELCTEDIQEAADSIDAERAKSIAGMLAIDGFRIELLSEAKKRAGDKREEYEALLRLMGVMEYINDSLKKEFSECRKELDEIMGYESSFDQLYATRQYELENLLVYYIYRYLLKAVRDGETEGRIKAAAAGVRGVRLLMIKRLKESGRLPSKEETAEIIKAYSQEIEYSPENMEKFW